MFVSLCIIAKNEAHNIGTLICSMAAQSIFLQPYNFEFVVVCNGCSDDTAGVARAALAHHFADTKISLRVHDTPEPGKARSWNLAVHEIINTDADFIVFVDADIQIKNNEVLAHLFSKLNAVEHVFAVSGWPVKNTVLKDRKSLIDRFSLRVSSQTPAQHSVNGSLYVGRANEFRKIWLPVPTPGEDGILTAMIHTNGFLKSPQAKRVQRADWPTHYFEAHTISGYFRHERRMATGTSINGWICEKLWAGEHTTHVGTLIRDWNEQDPLWVAKLISEKVDGRFWALPPRLLTWRLHNLRGVGLLQAFSRAPFSLVATILNIWPCVQANKALKNQGAANVW